MPGLTPAEESFACRVRELAAGGDGVATLPDGRVLFLPFTAPGDRVEARVVESHSRWARGRVLQVVEPGAARVAPPCPVFGRCGGCSWQHLAYPAQLRAKARILRDALQRIGGIVLDALPVLTPSPRPYAYRSRARLLRRGREVGLRARGAHELCALESCPVLAPELEAGLAELAASPADPTGEAEWELALGRGGALRCAPLDRRVPGGDPLELSVLGAELRVSVGVFVQANGLLLEELVRAVVEATAAGIPADARGLELHAGAGFFTLPLARRFREWVAVESDRRAVTDLRCNLDRAGASHVRVERARAGRLLAARVLREAPGRLHRVLLDPPRSGLERGAAQSLVSLAPGRIVYLSCDPATLARDARVLVEGGYRLRALRGFDLFPQTPHVESLSVWERRA